MSYVATGVVCVPSTVLGVLDVNLYTDSCFHRGVMDRSYWLLDTGSHPGVEEVEIFSWTSYTTHLPCSHLVYDLSFKRLAGLSYFHFMLQDTCQGYLK